MNCVWIDFKENIPEFKAELSGLKQLLRLGNLRGGLAMGRIFGAPLFSTVSGSSMACAAIMARSFLPSLLDEHKYGPRHIFYDSTWVRGGF